jgi:hypothetical protein
MAMIQFPGGLGLRYSSREFCVAQWIERVNTAN